MKNDDNYAYGIDALRFLAALLVAVFHFTYKNAEAPWAMPFGWIGVQIFFVISGVVIAKSANHASPKDFVIGRVMRLYPAAWIAAVISLSVLLIAPLGAYAARGIIINPTAEAFIHALGLMRGPFLASSYWTLPIELTFYALIFVSLLTGGRLTLLDIARGLVLVSFPYLLAASAHAASWINWPWLDLGFGVKNSLLVRHGPFFAIGVYIWALAEKRPTKRLDSVLLAVAVLLGITEISLLGNVALDRRTVTTPGVLIMASIVTFVVALAGIYLSMRYRRSMKLTPRVKHTLQVAGLMTYPFYLLHEVLGGFVLHHLGSLALPFTLRMCVALLTAGLAAYLVCTYAEPWVRRQLRTSIALFASVLSGIRARRNRSLEQTEGSRAPGQKEGLDLQDAAT